MRFQMLLCVDTCPEGFILVGKWCFLMCSLLQIALNWLAGGLSQPAWVTSMWVLAIICFVCLCPLSQIEYRSTAQPRAGESTLPFSEKAVPRDHESSHSLM